AISPKRRRKASTASTPRRRSASRSRSGARRTGRSGARSPRNEKGPVSRAFFGAARLERPDVARRRAFRAVGHFVLHLLRFLQRLEARHVDRAVMGEEVLAAVIRR